MEKEYFSVFSQPLVGIKLTFCYFQVAGAGLFTGPIFKKLRLKETGLVAFLSNVKL